MRMTEYRIELLADDPAKPGDDRWFWVGSTSCPERALFNQQVLEYCDNMPCRIVRRPDGYAA